MANSDENINASLGQYASNVRITDTTTTTPPDGRVFVAIKALADTTLDTILGNITDLDGAIIFAGDIVVGRFTSIILTSGDCIAYVGV